MSDMTPELYRALLAMDAYNRGYGAGIAVNTLGVGTALVGVANGDTAAQDISFFAQTYTLPSGTTVISFRGSDDKAKDTLYGYAIGLGLPFSEQGNMAIAFYNQVAGWLQADPRTANIELTGHSLSGGLAGYIASLYGKTSTLFDPMPFQTAAEKAYYYAGLWYNGIVPVPADPNYYL